MTRMPKSATIGLLAGSLMFGQACKDDTTGGTSPTVDGGGITTDAGVAGAQDGSASGDAASASDATSSDAAGCGVTFESAAAAAARFEGYWLIDDTGTCANATMLFITGGDPKNATDPDARGACSAPSTFMTVTFKRAKSCPPVDLCNQVGYGFFAHGLASGTTLPPNELLFRPDGSGGWKLSSDHIIKTTTGISFADQPFTPSSATANVCP